jgi:uncharacterized protein RhaS with RHS repeats
LSLVAPHQNYFRDFDPAVGKYVESDPLGLRAGVNTYAYVMSSPLLRRDPMGLGSSLALCLNPASAAACAEAGEITFAQADAIAKAAKAATALGAIVAGMVCGKDIECEEWLTLLNQNYSRLVFIESRGGNAEAEKLEHDQMVDMFCEHCVKECSRANRFKRTVH